MSNQQIPLAQPDITEAEIQAVLSVLKTGRLSIGPHLEKFEAACAKRAGREFGIGVNSGTSGLHLCMRALGIGKGDEVITTPFSFIATTNCIMFEGATPVLADIDADTYNLAPEAVKTAITSRTKAILPVEVFGITTHFDRYEKIAKDHGLLLIEDCCEALGGELNDRAAGNFGDCGVFAFYPNKQVTTGEGGMIVTDSKEIRDLCVSMRNQGRATEAWLSHARLGYNYRLDEMSAAMGHVQMSRLDEILTGRRRAAEMYDKALADIDGIHLPPRCEGMSWFVYVIRLDYNYKKKHRDLLLEYLRSAGIGCAPYFVPIHTQPHVAELLGTKRGNFPVTERIAARTLALPFSSRISSSQVDRVSEQLHMGLKHISAVK